MSGSPLRVRFDDSEWKRGVQALGRKFPQATRRALRRTATTVKAVIARDVAKDMKIKVGTAKAEIEQKLREGSIELSASLRRLPLTEFKAAGPEPSRGRGRGVSWNTGKGRRRLRSGFIATMPSGHRGVYARRGSRRLPIQELKGPSIGRVFAKVAPLAAPKAGDALRKNLSHEFARALAANA